MIQEIFLFIGLVASVYLMTFIVILIFFRDTFISFLKNRELIKRVDNRRIRK